MLSTDGTVLLLDFPGQRPPPTWTGTAGERVKTWSDLYSDKSNEKSIRDLSEIHEPLMLDQSDNVEEPRSDLYQHIVHQNAAVDGAAILLQIFAATFVRFVLWLLLREGWADTVSYVPVINAFIGGRVLQAITIYANRDITSRTLKLLQTRNFRWYKQGRAPGDLRTDFIANNDPDDARECVFFLLMLTTYLCAIGFVTVNRPEPGYAMQIALAIWSLAGALLMRIDPYRARCTIEKLREELTHKRFFARAQKRATQERQPSESGTSVTGRSSILSDNSDEDKVSQRARAAQRRRRRMKEEWREVERRRQPKKPGSARSGQSSISSDDSGSSKKNGLPRDVRAGQRKITRAAQRRPRRVSSGYVRPSLAYVQPKKPGSARSGQSSISSGDVWYDSSQDITAGSGS
jgi:hypothetical protein